MTGILLLFVLILWVVIAFVVVRLIAFRLPKHTWIRLLCAALFVVLVPLPLMDEILGKGQFEELCRLNATINADRVSAAGRTVYLAEEPNIYFENRLLRIMLKPWTYLDARTGEVVVSYSTIQAAGGTFFRFFGFSEGGGPLLFRGYCVPKEAENPTKLLREIGVTQIQRSARESKGK